MRGRVGGALPFSWHACGAGVHGKMHQPHISWFEEAGCPCRVPTLPRLAPWHRHPDSREREFSDDLEQAARCQQLGIWGAGDVQDGLSHRGGRMSRVYSRACLGRGWLAMQVNRCAA